MSVTAAVGVCQNSNSRHVNSYNMGGDFSNIIHSSDTAASRRFTVALHSGQE